MIQQIHFEVYIQRKWKQEFEEIMTFFFLTCSRREQGWNIQVLRELLELREGELLRFSPGPR